MTGFGRILSSMQPPWNQPSLDQYGDLRCTSKQEAQRFWANSFHFPALYREDALTAQPDAETSGRNCVVYLEDVLPTRPYPSIQGILHCSLFRMRGSTVLA